MKKEFLFFVALTGISLWVICSRAWSRAVWTAYTKADGLADNVVHQVFEDSKGNMWFATNKGASKYDGLRWITFTEADGLASNLTTSIWQDSEDHIWVGAFGGLSKYDGITWTTLEKPFKLSHWVEAVWETHEISQNTDILSIRGDSRGNIWIGTGVGLLEYDGNRWTWFYLYSNDVISPHRLDDWRVISSTLFVYSISEDNQGNVWFGTRRDGAIKFDGVTWKIFTKDDGLADNAVYSIWEDHQENMWFGTADGVTKYDGETWKTFTKYDGLADNAVYSIREDHQGNMWFGTADGVTIYKEGEWITFTIEDGLAHNMVLSILEDSQGNVWFATLGGVSKYNNTAWMTLSTETDFSYTSALPIGGSLGDNNVRTMFKDSQGNIWIATFVGVSKYNGKSWTAFTTTDGLASNTIWTIGEDAEGNIWFETDSGLTKFDGTTFTKADVEEFELVSRSGSSQVKDSQGNIWVAHFVGVGKGVSKSDGKSRTTFTTADGLASNNVTAICEDDEGNMWFGTDDRTGTDGMGVSRFDGVSWTTFTKADGLSSNFITAIVKDNGGNLWFGTIGGGVSIYDGKTWTALMGKHKTDYDDVQVVYKDSKGYMWFATYGGLIMHDGSTWRTLTTVDGLPRDHVWSILEDGQGNMWFATLSGVCKYDGIRFKTFTVADGLPDSRVWAIAEDNQGNIWVGTEYGIAKYDGRIWMPFTEKDGLVNNQVRSIAEDSQGNMWFGTLGGVSRYHGATWTTYTKENGLASNKVISVVKDHHGNMWFGTWDGGVSTYNGASWQTFTTADGLTSNFVWPILEDSQGNMWFGTDSGVNKFDDETWVTFTIMDGLSSNDIQSIFEDRQDNSIWFGTLAGAHRHQIDMVPPKIAIMAGPDDNSVITDDSVVFVYKGGDFITPNKDLLYSYSVWPDPNRPFPKVLDRNNPKQWSPYSPYSSATTASLTNLLDGIYVFRVTVKDKDLNRASASRTFTIDTTPATAAITGPENESIIGGEVVISGRAFDPDDRFKNYRVEYRERRENSSSDWKLLNYATTPVKDEQLAIWDTSSLNGKYDIRLTVVDGLNRKNQYPDVNVTVDNIDPDAKIKKPVTNSFVSGTVTVELEAADAHFDKFILEYSKAPKLERWNEIPSSSDKRIVQWNAHELEGEYALRLTVIDMAKNDSEDMVAVTVAKTIEARRGGYVEDLTGKVRIYIPPNALSDNTGITINQTPTDEFQASLRNLSSDIVPTNVAYNLHKEVLLLKKPATVTIRYSDDEIADVADETRLALFSWNRTSQNWQRIGGTVNVKEKTIKAVITKLSILAVMEDRRISIGKPSISQVHCQPRVFSPMEGVHNTETYISFKLGKESLVTIKVYNLDGKLKRVLTKDQRMSQGMQVVSWNGRNEAGEILPSGLYFIAIIIDKQTEIKTVVIQNR